MPGHSKALTTPATTIEGQYAMTNWNSINDNLRSPHKSIGKFLPGSLQLLISLHLHQPAMSKIVFGFLQHDTNIWISDSTL